MTARADSDAARDLVIDSVGAVARHESLPVVPDHLTEAWTQCALASGMGPVLGHQRRSEGLNDIAELSQSMRSAAAHHLTRLMDLRAIKKALDGADVRWLLFKGPAVAELAYAIPSSRTYSDLDILIHPADFERGLRALLDGPARLIDQNWEIIRNKEQGEISLAVGRTLLDLHWHFYSAIALRQAFQLDIRTVFEHAVEVKLGGVVIPTLDALDTTIFLATHAMLSGAHRLKWMFDFHCAAGRLNGEDGQLTARARSHDADLLVSVMASRTAHYFGTSRVPIQGRLSSGPWRAACSVTSRLAPPESDFLDDYTGRTVFTATRTSTADSCSQLIANARVFAKMGTNRRHSIIDRTALHSPGGTETDRRTWLDMVTSRG